MPRAGWVKPENDQRLSDHISLGVLTRVFPPELVDRVIDQAGRRETRNRLLPARVVVYYVLALALFSFASYEEVMRNLVEGLAWMSGWSRAWNVPDKAALFRARRRLGPEPMQALFEAVAAPLAVPGTRGAFYRQWRVMAIDGTCVDVADTEGNDAAFGRPQTGRGTGVGAFPQVRMVGLAECGTHALVKVALGPLATGERTLAAEVLQAAGPGMLVAADRGFFSFELWRTATQTGADLLWRVVASQDLTVEEELEDGSYLSRVYEIADYKRRGGGAVVRVVPYTIDDPGRPQSQPLYRLVTTILDSRAAPGEDLARLYEQRWEFETMLDELKTHQRGAKVVLRSKLPDGVVQELYGYLCVHYAIRWLMHSVALGVDADPDRLSFIHALRVARRTTASNPGFSPSSP